VSSNLEDITQTFDWKVRMSTRISGNYVKKQGRWMRMVGRSEYPDLKACPGRHWSYICVRELNRPCQASEHAYEVHEIPTIVVANVFM